MKKILNQVTLAVIAFLLIFGTSVSAATDAVTIKKVTDRTKNSMTLRIKYKTYKNKKVKIMVKAKDLEEDETKTKTFEVELDKKGEAKVTFDGLSEDTEYELKAKMKINKKNRNYTTYSALVKKKTDD